MSVISFDKNSVISIYSTGIESIIYKYKYGSKIIFLKIFKKEIGSEKETIKIVDKDFLLNKQKKIEIIPKTNCLSNEVSILGPVIYNNEFIGYAMEIDERYLKTASYYDKRKIKIEVLKQLKNKIEIFNSNGVHIGDIKESNILLAKDGSIKLGDLDNYKIGNLDIDLPSIFVKEYRQRVSSDENLDNYCFNLFTIAYIEGIYLPYIKKYIRVEGVPKCLDTKENREIIDSMMHLDDTYKKRYLIDYMK
ncbi:MAG: hypothetical protein J6J17_00680 [Bacilli bacterium]|nr:hypothetical protein [Bacilli bacterium]